MNYRILIEKLRERKIEKIMSSVGKMMPNEDKEKILRWLDTFTGRTIKYTWPLICSLSQRAHNSQNYRNGFTVIEKEGFILI